jgi:hypothetical protein
MRPVVTRAVACGYGFGMLHCPASLTLLLAQLLREIAFIPREYALPPFRCSRLLRRRDNGRVDAQGDEAQLLQHRFEAPEPHINHRLASDLGPASAPHENFQIEWSGYLWGQLQVEKPREGQAILDHPSDHSSPERSASWTTELPDFRRTRKLLDMKVIGSY